MLAIADFIRHAAGVAQAVSAERRRRQTAPAPRLAMRARAFPGRSGRNFRSVAHRCKLPGAASLRGAKSCSNGGALSRTPPRKSWPFEARCWIGAPRARDGPRACSSDSVVSVASAPRKGEVAAFCCVAAPGADTASAGGKLPRRSRLARACQRPQNLVSGAGARSPHAPGWHSSCKEKAPPVCKLRRSPAARNFPPAGLTGWRGRVWRPPAPDLPKYCSRKPGWPRAPSQFAPKGNAQAPSHEKASWQQPLPRSTALICAAGCPGTAEVLAGAGRARRTVCEAWLATGARRLHKSRPVALDLAKAVRVPPAA